MRRFVAQVFDLKTYRTGKHCKNGHLSFRYTSNGNCSLCVKSFANTNPLVNTEAVKKYQSLNREKVYAVQRKWKFRNVDKVKLSKKRFKGAEGSFTQADVNKIKLNQNSCCNYCSLMAEKLTIDHIKPLSKGGTNWPENIQLLCGPCNSRKSAKYPYVYTTP